MEEKIKNLKGGLETIRNNKYIIYFFIPDTKGNPIASVSNIYEHVKILRNNGIDARLLHEKKDYKLNSDDKGMGLTEWLGEEYANFPHHCVENNDVNITVSDFVIIPEIFSNVMESTTNFPGKRIVFAQSYDYILEILDYGKNWKEYGINDVITTSNTLSKVIGELFGEMNFKVIPCGISDKFIKIDKPRKPYIAIHTRGGDQTSRIIKTFFLKYPQFKWVTFRDMRGLSVDEFAETLAECCIGVWVDDISSFGTFPLECFKTGTPVIGKVPNLVPEWLKGNENNVRENGVWTNNILQIPDLINIAFKSWLEDNIPNEIYKNMDETIKPYTMSNMVETTISVYKNIVKERQAELSSLLVKEEKSQKLEIVG